MHATKLVLLLAGVVAPVAAVNWAAKAVEASAHRHLETADSRGKVSVEDMASCVKQAKQFLSDDAPKSKGMAIEAAIDHCALDKKVEDRNFVCPHYKSVLNGAFRRESTLKKYGPKSFCTVSETYVGQLKKAHKIPNVGDGAGDSFELSKSCKPTVLASLAPEKKLTSGSAADFWYALCMNQDCAHFLPSRTRWCDEDHSPTHSQVVCEALRNYAKDETDIVSSKELDAEQVCSIYEEFVEDTHVNVQAYMVVTHGKVELEEKVPSPDDPKRALQSSQMKNEAGAHGLRDGSGKPVKSGAAGVILAPTGLLLAVFLGLSIA